MVVRTSFFTLAVVITLSAATSTSHGIAAYKSPSESSRVLRQAETAEGDHKTMSASEMCLDDAFFSCGDGDGLICVEEACDGIDDCPDGSDEHDCESMGDSRCAGESSACADGVGVTCDDQLCDGREDCLDGSDELNCGSEPEQKCFSEYSFTCTDGEGDVCLEFMCDGKEDCNDGSDEMGCDGRQTTPVSAPTPGAARPTPTPKSPAPTLATEASIPNPGAPQAPCAGNTFFACTGGSEVCAEQVCDGTHDCEDGADEQNCDPPTPRRPSYASGDPTSSSSSPASGTPTLSTPPVMNDLIHQTQSVASKVDTTASPLISIASTVQSPPSVSGAITSPSFFTASGASMLMSPPPLASDNSSLDISSSSGVSTASSSPSASVIPTSLKLYVFEDHTSSIRSMASGASTTSTVSKYPSGFGDLSSPSSFTAADASISKSPTSLDDQKESFPELSSYDSNIEISPTSAVPTTSRSSTDASVLLSPSPSLGVHAKSMPPLVSDDPYLENLETAVDSMPGAYTTSSTSEMPSIPLGSGIFSHQSTFPESNTPTPQALSIASSISTGSTSFISDVFPLLNTPISSDAHTPTNPSSLSDDKSPPTSPSASSVSLLNTFYIKAISSTTPGPFPFTAIGASSPPMSYPASSFSRDITTKSLSSYLTNPTSENKSNTSTNTSSTPPASNIGGYTTPRPQLATENINSLLRNHGFDGSTAPIKPNAFDSFTFPISPTLSGFATHSSALTTSGASSSSITSFISSALILEKSHTVSGASNLPTHATADGANSFSSNPGLDGPTKLHTYPAFDPSIAPKLLAKLSAPSNVFTTTGAQTLSIQSSVYNASTSSSLSSGSEGHYTSNSPQSPGSHTPVTSIDIPDEFDYFFTPYQSRDLHVPTPGSSLYSLNIQNPPNFVNSEASILQSSPVKLNTPTLPSSHHVSVVSSVTNFPPVSKASTLSYPSASGAPSTSTSPVLFTPTMRSFSLSTLSSRIPFSSNFTHPTSSRTSVLEKSTEQSIVLNINTTTTLSPASNLSAASIAFTSENVPTQPDVATLQNSSRASDDHTLPSQLIASDDRSPPNQSQASDDHTPPSQPQASDDHTPPNQPLASDDHTPPNQPLASDDHTPPDQPLASDDHAPPNQPLASDDHTPPNQPLASDDHTPPNQPLASDDHTPPHPPLAPDNHASPKQPLASGNRNIAILSPARNIPPWSLWSPPSRRRPGRNSVKSATNMASSHTARGIVCALTTTLLASGVLIVLY